MNKPGTDMLAKSWELTEERFQRRNKKRTGKGRPRIYCGTPLGRKATAELFLKPLASFLSWELEDKPQPPPGDLGQVIYNYKLNPQTLALIALAPLLDAINRGWKGDDTESAAMLLRMKIGRYLRDRLQLERLITSEDKEPRAKGRAVLKLMKSPKAPKRRKRIWRFLKSDWDTEHIVKAGIWLLECAMSMPYFVLDERGFPKIAPDWQEDVDCVASELLQREQVLLPLTELPPDWTGWFAQYDNRLWKTFVRDWRPQTRGAITQTFRDNPDFEQAKGVNALQRVPFLIDEDMLKLVQARAVEIMGHEADKEQREADERIVKADVEVAKLIGNRPFYLTFNCDRRGRVYGIPHLHYGREDHVRALYKFANGLALGPDGIQWLEINCANCGGFEGVNKKSWGDRLDWARDTETRKMIERIARSPDDTIKLWSDADRPFAFVAACRELDAALKHPDRFITHLPVEFDGSANGIQHLALLAHDDVAARRVNLVKADEPHDVYQDVIVEVRQLLELDDDKWAAWWLERFDLLGIKKVRKLIKTPAMTFAYNAETWGMADKIKKVGRDRGVFASRWGDVHGPRLPDCVFTLNACGFWPAHQPTCSCGAYFLAEKIREACEKVLPGPAGVMQYIGKLADHCTDEGRPLEWDSPTGFPVSNRYNISNTELVYGVEDGVEVEYTVANGVKPDINQSKARNSSAPNLVHSQDAAHLIRTVNAANDEDIFNIVTVHDAFACLAPQAQRFNQTIREQLYGLYKGPDVLWLLRDRNMSKNANFQPPPHQGVFNPRNVLSAEYCWA
jgi:DNA-dependent RNA polymerase-like protein